MAVYVLGGLEGVKAELSVGVSYLLVLVVYYLSCLFTSGAATGPWPSEVGSTGGPARSIEC